MPKRPILLAINLMLFLLGVLLGYRGWLLLQRANILVEWTTASELDTVGFNLYRSEIPGELGQRINRELIPASTDPLTGASYRFEDRDVQAGMHYYYTLEEIEISGAANQAGLIEVTAKQSGWLEIALAVILLGGVAVGLFKLVGSERGISG